jgi:hypothetical protein
MMGTEDIEQLLERARFKHLSESTLVSYNDDQLDEVGQALADAHLRLCLICERRLTFLKEESEALENYVTTEEDKASITKLLANRKSKLADYISAELERFNSYVQELLAAWTLPHRKLAMRDGPEHSEVWQYKSKDGVLTVRTSSNRKDDLTVQFSSIELGWEGFRIHFRLGAFHKDVTLRRKGNKVIAKVVVPKQERTKQRRKISIEVTSDS